MLIAILTTPLIEGYLMQTKKFFIAFFLSAFSLNSLNADLRSGLNTFGNNVQNFASKALEYAPCKDNALVYLTGAATVASIVSIYQVYSSNKELAKQKAAFANYASTINTALQDRPTNQNIESLRSDITALRSRLNGLQETIEKGDVDAVTAAVDQSKEAFNKALTQAETRINKANATLIQQNATTAAATASRDSIVQSKDFTDLRDRFDAHKLKAEQNATNFQEMITTKEQQIVDLAARLEKLIAQGDTANLTAIQTIQKELATLKKEHGEKLGKLEGLPALVNQRLKLQDASISAASATPAAATSEAASSAATAASASNS